ncbi:Cyclin-A2-1 [Monoraphidium neglectum]|uniref:Cyclin-A2-1 n=1 Tax=Monoraphidium neglectum TaxID=145388 RepID=A0A0D2KIW2_9CHLO|nr:Cyclin-A2-1 [Monoraphidium neglectum]KIY95733.1 Cyclin-A2-1 [Monoraphidium neglectum]|eukprot:XP_013894753.1 Cyclin-A2-1 [Monoraphidium neglectum]
MPPPVTDLFGGSQRVISDVAACSLPLCLGPASATADDSRYLKRLKATVLSSFPAFVSVQHGQQLQQPSCAQQAACSDRQQYAPARRTPARDQTKPPKIRRVACIEEERPGRGYDPEFLAHCYADEAKGAPDCGYLGSVQREVDAHKRLVLVDWLVEVVDEFKLAQGTLFLAVNLVDRYLSRRPVPRAALQLLGVTALWLASKFEEVYPPTLSDFVDVTQHSCTAAQLVEMEAHLLCELGFTLMVPTAVTFLALFLPAAAANAADADAYLSAAIDGDGCDTAACLGEFPRRVAHLAEYLAELSLLTPECLRFPPSLVAAAALNLACSLLDAAPGARARLAPAAEAAAAQAGPGGEERLRACVAELRRMYAYAARAPRPPAVKTKYCSSKRSCVAAMPPPRWALDA